MTILKWLLTGLLAIAGCANARQIVLSIDTTIGVPCEIDRIRVVAKASGITTIDESLKGARLPISVTLLDDTPSGGLMVDISGFKGDIEVLRASGLLRFGDHVITDKVLLGPNCKADTPCALADAMSTTAGPEGSARFQCDGNVTRYRAEPIVEGFVDACEFAPPAPANRPTFDSTGKAVLLMDVEKLMPNFGFQFYGAPLHQIWVAKNGYISFALNNPDSDGVLVPGPLDRDIKHIGEPPPPQSVMVFWDTLTLDELRDTNKDQVCYAFEESPMGQRLHVTWKHACVTQPCDPADSRNNLNFTITLEEGTNRVVLTYGDMVAGNADRARGATATVGLASDVTNCPVEECVLATGQCKGGTTPCGYSQVFSNAVQSQGLPNMQFTPIIDP